jgi:hypothetical protein
MLTFDKGGKAMRVSTKVVLDMETMKVVKRISRKYFGPVDKMGGWTQALESQVASGPLSLGPNITNAAAVGANPINPVPGLVLLTAAGVVTATLPLPIAGPPGVGDDGKIICFISTTANAHTVTTPAGGLNKTLHIATFAAAVGAYMWLVAFGGSWYVLNSNSAAFVNNVTLT